MNNEEESKQKKQPEATVDVVQALLQSEDPSDTTEFLKSRISKDLTEEQLLWYDVIAVALWDYKDSLNVRDAAGHNLFNEVFDWVFNKPEDSTYLGTYENICTHLDINPSVLRSKLMRYTKQYYVNIQERLPSVVVDIITPAYTNSIYISKKGILPEE